MTEFPEVPITAEGLAEIKRELEELVSRRRPEIIARIKAAREHGDLSENFEYHAARNEQSFVESRIRELETIVRHHVLIEPQSEEGTVGPLSTVTFVDESGVEETYRLVGPAEADPAAGKVSLESPIGQALCGHRVGDEVEVRTPSGGAYRVRIVRVR